MATKINPYLNFKEGTCKAAFNFYKKAFGGEFTMVLRPDETPIEVTENEKNYIMYMELPIGNDKLMGSDVFESMGQSITIGNNNYVYISVESKAEADRLFYELSEGGEVEMPISKQFFGYFRSFKDKFNVHWMISFEE